MVIAERDSHVVDKNNEPQVVVLDISNEFDRVSGHIHKLKGYDVIVKVIFLISLNSNLSNNKMMVDLNGNSVPNFYQ